MRYVLITLFLVTSFAISFIVGFAPVAEAQWPGAGKMPPTPVITAPVTKEIITDEVEALGTLKANESVDITSSVTEIVTAVNFEDGQNVEKGTVLVEMDASEERASLSEEESVMAEANRQIARLTPLVARGAASESTLDDWKKKAETAQSRLNAINARIDKRRIIAPFDGLVGLRNISVGALAQPGSVLTTIDDDSVMKLDFSVPSIFLSTLSAGVVIEATAEAYPGEVFKGTISSIDSRIDPITRSIVARALISNETGKLKPGLLMQVCQKSPREAVIVPEEALIPEGSRNSILVTITGDDGSVTAEKRVVELGERQFGKAEILSGISEGEHVITHGTLRVRPGIPLKVQAEETGEEPLPELLKQNSLNQRKTKP